MKPKIVPDPDKTSLSDSLCRFPCRNPAREQKSDDPTLVRLQREAGSDIVRSPRNKESIFEAKNFL
jgi:hypothetical protein